MATDLNLPFSAILLIFFYDITLYHILDTWFSIPPAPCHLTHPLVWIMPNLVAGSTGQQRVVFHGKLDKVGMLQDPDLRAKDKQ